MKNTIKIILPEGVTPEDLRELLSKSTPEIDPSPSFQDLAIEGIAEEMFRIFDEVSEEMIEEISTILDAEYGDL